MACTSHETLLLDFSNVPHIDVSTAMALEEVILDSHLAAQNVLIVGAKFEVEKILHGMRVATLIPDNYHFPDRTAALEAAAQLLSAPDSEL